MSECHQQGWNKAYPWFRHYHRQTNETTTNWNNPLHSGGHSVHDRVKMLLNFHAATHVHLLLTSSSCYLQHTDDRAGQFTDQLLKAAMLHYSTIITANTLAVSSGHTPSLDAYGNYRTCQGIRVLYLLFWLGQVSVWCGTHY